MSLKKEVVLLLEEMADLMEFDGQNRFKVNAFKNGANTIRRLESDIEEMINDKSIKEIKGIGKGLQQVIFEFYETGSSKEYEELVKKVPEGIHDVLRIRGLGAKKVKQLYDELKIDSIEKLESAARAEKISELKGFSTKSTDKILAEIERIKKSSGYMLLSKAIERSKKILEMLSPMKNVEKAEVTGELRRIREIISVIELICAVNSKEKFLKEVDKIFNYKLLTEFTSCDKYIFIHESLGEFELFLTDKENYSRTLLQTTGSSEFLQKIHDPENNTFTNEKDYFKKNNLNFVIPEMREEEYFDAPKNLREQTNLTLEHFNGFFHFHTTFSDGNNTLEEMLRGIKEHGFKYAVVCDHSKSAFYANGLKEARIEKQRSEINKINETSDIKVYHGIESDILRDGSLDYDKEVLKEFDFIVASIHSNFNMSEDDMTNRVIKAIENEYTDLLAHPTGRLLLARDGYRINIQKIIDACVQNDVAIEINANPHRLDLDWRHLYYAREKGCKISINPDAHSVEGIQHIEYGIMIARKGGVQPGEIINCFTEKEFQKYINRKVKRKS